MSIADLQTWLLNEGIRGDLDELTSVTVEAEIDNLIPKAEVVSKPLDWTRLLFAGSILARSDLRAHQEAALRIATGAVTFSDSPTIKDAGAILLRKLSNFRAVALAGKRNLILPDLDSRLGLSLRMEAQRRQMDQSILVQANGSWLQVNDFQQRFWSQAISHGWLSASAPTASGKTFLVLQWLIDQIRSGEVRVAVYLAPTRALVSEIENSLDGLVGKQGEIEVSSLPLKAKFDAARSGGKRLVLVFTQERLHLMANILGEAVGIDLMIVDEAHKIGDDKRGVIRLEVERLFRSGKIRFLICTSTLIEGVNLSCRTIVMRGPQKGLGHPMEPHDFWNLAGRAGRWGDEFQGNIICIDPQDTHAWPEGVPKRARYPIKRESDAVIELGDGMADYLDRRAGSALADLDNVDQFEQVGSYLLTTYLRMGSIANSTVANRHDAATMKRLDQSLATIASQIEITADVAARHPGVSALGMQHLLDAFRRYDKNIENLLPATVDSQDSYDRLVTIMRRINEHLFPAFLPEGLIPLHALIVVQWLKGFSLAVMIRRNIEYHQKNGKAFRLPILIRHTMELVERIARFQAPKYLSAYMDILNMHLHAVGRDDLIDHDLDIGTQLEFGVSSRTLLSLMELGMSRMSAVALYEKIARDDLNAEDCLAWVYERATQLEGMDIPAIIVREIRAKLLSADDGESGSVAS